MRVLIIFISMLYASVSFAETVTPGDMAKQNTPPVAAAANMSDIHDINDLMPAHGIPGWLVIIVSIAAAGLIALATYLIWKRFRNSSRKAEIAILSPWDEALSKLDKLSESISTFDDKIFYFSISEILRRYVSRRFDVDAMGMTVEELRPAMDSLFESDRTIAGLKSDLRAFFTRCELTKYSPERGCGEMKEEDIDLVKAFVQKTTPIHKDAQDKI